MRTNVLGMFKMRVNGGKNKRLFGSIEVRLKEIDASQQDTVSTSQVGLY